MRPFVPALFVACLLGTVATAPADAATIRYAATLTGGQEVPANPSTGTGSVTVRIVDNETMIVALTFAGLTGSTTVAHIHAGAFGFNGPVMTTTPSFEGFPVGVTSGGYDASVDLLLASSYNPAFVTGHGGVPQARAAFLATLASGGAYFNLHSTAYPGGELRGQLALVPLPAGAALLALALAALGGAAALRRRAA
ncbi:MAG: CHRD domain-containing protein [Gemmobacter sp.]